jgi:hypothetical protein
MWTCEVYCDRQENSTVAIIEWLTSTRVAGNEHGRIATDIIGSWLLLQRCSFHVFWSE